MIAVDGLKKVFADGAVAVDGVSFRLEEGEVGCLIGTSGCGKTTTLKMINRLVAPTAGSIWVGGILHSEEDPVQWRRKIGYVIQKAGLMPHLTVKQNIELLSRILKRSKKFMEERVRHLMDMVSMPFAQFADRYPVELSGGQQQRVGIARALMEDPPVLLMDEPFGALDPITRTSLHKELRHLNKKLKKTILMVTHDMDEAFELGDKIIVMDKGAIVQMGSPDELARDPQSQFVRDFVKGRGHA